MTCVDGVGRRCWPALGTALWNSFLREAEMTEKSWDVEWTMFEPTCAYTGKAHSTARNPAMRAAIGGSRHMSTIEEEAGERIMPDRHKERSMILRHAVPGLRVFLP